MLTVGILARLKAKQGKEHAVRELLKQAEGLARAEAKTVVWYAFEGDGQFYIFDAFADESGRKEHLEGPIAQALMKVAPELLAEPPDIKPVSLLAVK
jgi:quinol monooxygenase YgiN